MGSEVHSVQWRREATGVGGFRLAAEGDSVPQVRMRFESLSNNSGIVGGAVHRQLRLTCTDRALTVPRSRLGQERRVYRNILVPIDGSAMATQGLREAIELARRLGSRIRLLHVLNQTPWTAPGLVPATMADLMIELRRAGESILERGRQEVAAAHIEVEAHLIQVIGERVGETVIEDAKSWSADLIVCGTHGRRGVRRLLLGSDAEYIVRLSPVPVLLIRTPEGSSAAD